MARVGTSTVTAAACGDYAAMVMVADTFDIQLRPGQTPLLPIPAR